MKNDIKTIKIEQITAKDIPSVREIEKECFSGEFNEKFENLISNPSYVYILAREENEVTGYAGASIEYEQSDLIYVAVKERYRNKGIASLLLKVLFEKAKSMGAEEMFLEVNEENTAAIKLYEKLGFVFLNKRKNYYGDKSALVYVKALKNI